MRKLFYSIAVAALIAGPAFADDICVDRPTKSTGPCVVDNGHFQLETDIFNTTVQTTDGIKTTSDLFLNPTIKYGLKNMDVELNLSPLETVRTGKDTTSGIGDLYGRVKIAIVTKSSWQLSVIPYVKMPTARVGVGNGVLEGGFIVPTNVKIDDTWSVTFDPEFDVLKNAANSGTHLNTAQVVSFSASLPHKIGAYVELWADYNFDQKMVSQYSFDVGTSWTARPDLEIDGGVNFGLNKATPATQFYVGFGKHF